MKLDAFMDICEKIAPMSLAEHWDNCGLLIEPDCDDITLVLVALDPTPMVAREAVDIGANLLLTHHPLFLNGVKRITRADPATQAAWILLRNGIGLYAAHTNLDSAEGGVSDSLAKALELKDIRRVESGEAAALRIGSLEPPRTLDEFNAHVCAKLDARARYCGAPERVISRVAVCGGAGMSLAPYAAELADVFVTADIKHHQALDSGACGLALIDATHQATERAALSPLIHRLQAELNAVQYNVQLVRSKCEPPVFNC